jgi:hypothetical protein
MRYTLDEQIKNKDGELGKLRKMHTQISGKPLFFVFTNFLKNLRKFLAV